MTERTRLVLNSGEMVEISHSDIVTDEDGQTSITPNMAMCRHCIDYLKTQGYKLMVGDEVDEWDDDRPTECGWCEEEGETLYWVIW